VSTPNRSSLYIIPITLFSIIYNIPKFFELSYHSECAAADTEDGEESSDSLLFTNSSECLEKTHLIKATPLRFDYYYSNYYLIYSNFIVHAVVPFCLLYTSIWSSSERFPGTKRPDPFPDGKWLKKWSWPTVTSSLLSSSSSATPSSGSRISGSGTRMIFQFWLNKCHTLLIFCWWWTPLQIIISSCWSTAR